MKKWISILLVFILLMGLLSGCTAKTSTNAEATASDETYNTDFDDSIPPPDVRPVVVVSGSPKEMGVQYGEQARDLIARNIAVVKSKTLPLWGSWEDIVKRMDKYEAEMVKNTPEVVEMWKGIAEGSKLPYDDIRLINLSLSLLIMTPEDAASNQEAPQCSHISVWGSAVKEQKMIAGGNTDSTWNTGTYTVVLIAYPDNGNAFIMTPPWAGIAGVGFGLNSKGLVILSSGGQAARPEDSQFGVDNMASRLKILMECDTAEQAKDQYLSHHCSSAENAQFVDKNGAVPC